MRAYDWSSSRLGSPDHWPQSLRTAIRILLTTQHPMFIWWGPDLIQFYNDAYRQTMGPERHPSALGQPGRECWQEIWSIIGPQIELVMRGGGATWHEDQLVPVTRHGKREDVWWTYSFGPIDDETAPKGIGGVLVVCNDVTDRHRAFDALALNEERLTLALSAGVIGTWDWDVRNDRFVADTRLALAYGVDPKAAAAGVPLAAFVEAIHRDDRERVERRVAETLKSGDDFAEEYRLVVADGPTRWVLARGRCYRDSTGQATRFPGAAIDITDRKLAEEHRELLTDELSHRSRNMLAIVQAIAQQTLKDGVTIGEARKKLSARLIAMSRAQDILTGRGVAGVELESILRAALNTLADEGDRIRLQGPNLAISPRSSLSFALAFHELATNAVKYGALSGAEGRVDISWHIAKDSDRLLELVWSESGGPPVSTPTRKGFGSRLIESVMTAELGVFASVDYAPSGVIWRIAVPLARID
jgi:two-component sensor histidine kinase/PAS domain-containing protein